MPSKATPKPAVSKPAPKPAVSKPAPKPAVSKPAPKPAPKPVVQESCKPVTPINERLDKSRYGGNSPNDVFNKAAIIKGKDPEKYRVGPDGKEMYSLSYGKTSDKGWEIDHIKPKSKGGSDNIRNLQALNTSTNRSLQDSTDKPSRHDKN